MATTAPRTTVPRDEYVPTGWVSFAAIILFVSAFFSSMWGLAAILNSEVVTVGGRGVTILDFTTWGWVHLVLGVIMGLSAYALLSGRTFGRVMGIIFATLNAMAQVAAFSAFPLWSLAVLALDVVVIYQLTARWQSAR